MPLGITPAGAGTSPARPGLVGGWGNHPRRRGDFISVIGLASIAAESPPQARGLLQARPRTDRHEGITPAGAGTSVDHADRVAPCRNHPRRRGDFLPHTEAGAFRAESPPQARGLRQSPLSQSRPAGITPAGAGTSRAGDPRTRGRRNHPRRRGDFITETDDGGRDLESPPQARGLPDDHHRERHGRGITPAGAGTSREPRASCHREGNHPRRRGDFSSRAYSISTRKESPPQARGLHQRGASPRCRDGITPAGAGTSWSRSPGWLTTWNHPRRRGDFTGTVAIGASAEESPPQARGLLDRQGDRGPVTGITPAGAGTSQCGHRAPRRDGNHPRRRGDFSSAAACAPCGVESPPQARGLHLERFRAMANPGITPAGAGTSGWLRQPGNG